MRLLLDRETEAGRAVVEKRSANPKRRLVDKDAVVHTPRLERLAPKALVAAQARAARTPFRIDLPDIDNEVAGIVLDQVPGVRGELVLDLGRKSGRAVQAHAGVAAEADAQQPVEPDEMVHVRVRHKHVRNPQYLFWRQRREIAEIEQQRPFLEFEIDVQTRIAEGVVDECVGEYRAHGGELRSAVRYHPGLTG